MIILTADIGRYGAVGLMPRSVLGYIKNQIIVLYALGATS